MIEQLCALGLDPAMEWVCFALDWLHEVGRCHWGVLSVRSDGVGGARDGRDDVQLCCVECGRYDVRT